MAKENAPHMPWYGREFYSDENVIVLTLEQEAAYLRLLWNCWQEGSIPEDTGRLAAICKNTPLKKFDGAIWPALRALFAPGTDGRLMHCKVEKLRAAKEALREERSKAGKVGNAVRWGNRDSADPSQTGSQNVSQNVAADCRMPNAEYREPIADVKVEEPSSSDIKKRIVVDDEPQKPEYGYASPFDELKAMFRHRFKEDLTEAVVWRITDALNSQFPRVTPEELLNEAKKHLGHGLKNPVGFLTDLAQHFRSKTASREPAEALPPAPEKCEHCHEPKGKGTIFLDGPAKFVACPVCATPEWVAYIETINAREGERRQSK